MEDMRSAFDGSACALCGAAQTRMIHAVQGRTFLRCAVCDLVFAPRAAHPTPAETRARYDLHRNAPSDGGYFLFLTRLAAPLSLRLAPGARGLDYGCGPGPTLSLLLCERGFEMQDYDPLYHDHRELLARSYDFVTCTEVVEHFAEPAKEWTKLLALVKPGGWLGIMTEFHHAGTDFNRWHYATDLTHLCFYSRATFDWIAATFRLQSEIPESGVALMLKPPV